MLDGGFYRVAPVKIATYVDDRRRSYKRTGERAGMIAGGLAGAAFPLMLGGTSGEHLANGVFDGTDAIRQGLDMPNMSDFDPSVADTAHDVLGTGGRIVGTGVGLGLTPLTTIGGAMLGGKAGRQMGRETAAGQHALEPAHARAQKHTRTLNPSQAAQFQGVAQSAGAPPKVQGAIQQELDSKYAAPQHPVHNLNDVGIGPSGAGDAESHGRSIGAGLGGIHGLATSIGGPAILGSLGHTFGGTLHEGLADKVVPEWVTNATETLRDSSPHLGAAVGGAAGMAMLGARALAPAAEMHGFENLGGGVGKLVGSMAPMHKQVVSQVYNLPPDKAHGYVAALHASGKHPPEVLQAADQALQAVNAATKTSEWDPLQDTTLDPYKLKNRSGLFTAAGLVGGGIAGYALGDSAIDSMTSEAPDIDPESVSASGHSLVRGLGTVVGGAGGAMAGHTLGKGITSLPNARGLRTPRAERDADRARIQDTYHQGVDQYRASLAPGHPSA